MVRTLLLFALLSLTATATAAPPAATPSPRGDKGVSLAPVSTKDRPVVVTMVHESAELKLATITMREGARMKEHSAHVPVTIIAVVGEADILMPDGTKQRTSPGRLVALDANVEHAVQALGKGEIVLLVHHVKPPKKHAGH